jgi:hypothetical protein
MRGHHPPTFSWNCKGGPPRSPRMECGMHARRSLPPPPVALRAHQQTSLHPRFFCHESDIRHNETTKRKHRPSRWTTVCLFACAKDKLYKENEAEQQRRCTIGEKCGKACSQACQNKSGSSTAAKAMQRHCRNGGPVAAKTAVKRQQLAYPPARLGGV